VKEQAITAMDPKDLTAKLSSARVLLVDDEPYMRKVVRTMLLGLGVRAVHEAEDGLSGLAMIRTHAPDVVILDWEMPGLNGTSFVRMVRSPETFPLPDVPIVMLTGHGEKQRVIEAVCVGVNEFLLKPVSTNALRDRLVSVLLNPRKIVSSGPYYGPMPRKFATALHANAHADTDEAVARIFMVN
jgi:two-component system chemotaxis response regulator CheY